MSVTYIGMSMATAKCPECNCELIIGQDSKYHHSYLDWNGICTPKTMEDVWERK